MQSRRLQYKCPCYCSDCDVHWKGYANHARSFEEENKSVINILRTAITTPMRVKMASLDHVDEAEADANRGVSLVGCGAVVGTGVDETESGTA
jgi:hypothetical protein